MLFGFIVGGILGGVMYVSVESIFGDKIGETPKKIIGNKSHLYTLEVL